MSDPTRGESTRACIILLSFINTRPAVSASSPPRQCVEVRVRNLERRNVVTAAGPRPRGLAARALSRLWRVASYQKSIYLSIYRIWPSRSALEVWARRGSEAQGGGRVARVARLLSAVARSSLTRRLGTNQAGRVHACTLLFTETFQFMYTTTRKRTDVASRHGHITTR